MRYPVLLISQMILCLLLFQKQATACSMYKVTADGRTMVGCNEDAWRTTSRIWFVNASKVTEYGAAFTGSRQVGPNRFAPQSGMNEAGLVFSRLSAYHPEQNGVEEGLEPISDEATYLTAIMQQCATVEEVAELVGRYDRSFFIGDVFIYVDAKGNYLIVEPYKLIPGSDAAYVLSNFCPSITEIVQANQLERYRNGAAFIERHAPKTTRAYCRALSDTMHVCRSRNGDGTLLTSIWDTDQRRVNLYFYHDFDTTVQFVLSEELAKGDHMLAIPELFPTNVEFERLQSYVTPFNTPLLRYLLVFGGGMLTLFALVLGARALRMRSNPPSRALFGFALLNLLLTVYLIVLALNKSVYYFDAPYQHYSSDWISATSYIPLLLLFAILPAVTYSIRSVRSMGDPRWLPTFLVTNNAIYLVLLFGFGYWGFFRVFG